MFTNLIVATDLSPASDAVVGCLHGLRALGARKVILFHALGLRHLEVMKYELARLAESKLQAQRAMLEQQGFETEIVVAPGSVSAEIEAVVKERAASLIAVGSRGANLARQALLGSVAMEVLHHATVPVLIVRLAITETHQGYRCKVACQNFVRHILYATDFSDTAERAFAWVERLAAGGAERVTLLHVQDQTRIDPHLKHRLAEFNEIDHARLERLKARLLEKGLKKVWISIPFGSPIQEILREARADDQSLIVMGSQGRGMIGEVFLGSVSHQIARLAPTPVLLVPAPR